MRSEKEICLGEQITDIHDTVLSTETQEDYDKVQFLSEFWDKISIQDLLKILPNEWPGYPRD